MDFRALVRRARRGAGGSLVVTVGLVFGTPLACVPGPYEQTSGAADTSSGGTTAVDPSTTGSTSSATVATTTTTGPSTTGEPASTSTTGAGSTTGDTSTGAPPVCGDSVVDEGEECDDGNADDADACTAACKAAVCGDGKTQAGVEQCDDGNTDNADGCTIECITQHCGDGMIQGSEQCDDGNADDTDACPSTCLNATCGDGYTEAGVEQCDVGNESPFCDGDCTLPECGDLHVNLAAGEECDDGSVTPDCDGDCTFPKCGDGFKNEGSGEECDDGNTAAGDGCSDTCAKEKRVVFVSSVLYTGNLGGLAGADAKCQQLANAAGLAGTFKAWLSDSQNSPSSRFLKSKVPYVLPGGAQIAKSWNDLTDGVILHAIDQTEMKSAPPPAMQCNSKATVWTNTREDGTSWNGNVCGNFTNTTADGRLGTSMAINYTWTRHCSGAAGTCAWKAPIYCFEQ